MKGKLTYAVAVLGILWGVSGFLMGWADQETAMAVVWASLAVFGIRRAIN